MPSCIEKHMEDNSLCDMERIIYNYCPHDFGYTTEESDKEACDNHTCEKCWDREVETDMVTELRKKFDIPEPYQFKSMDELREVLNSDIKENRIEYKPNLFYQHLQEQSEEPSKPRILDSGNRREFESGAVRDIQEGKGRCDLLPLDVVSQYYYDIGLDIAYSVFELIGYFKTSGNTVHLLEILKYFCEDKWDKDCNTMFLEVSKHFEEGAKKYGDNNWQKGIPVRCYIDSAVRHYFKFLRGDKDEPHDRAFCWNILCAIWTCKHKPELNDYADQTQQG